MEAKFELGDSVECIITGFTGIVTGVAIYLNGCITYGVLDQKLDDKGEMKKTKWFDEPQLICVEKQKINVKEKQDGGMMPIPERNIEPK
jgi:hypothetical protein